MRAGLALWMALMIAMAGCTVEPSDGNGTDLPEGGETPVDPVEEDPDEHVSSPGEGDPKEDTKFVDDYGPSNAPWTQEDHHFRVVFGVDGESGRDVRLTIDVGQALDEAGLEWIAPGVPLSAIDPDPESVVIEQISSAGRATATLSVDARKAGTHALEVAFFDIGGDYIMYFDEARSNVPGGPTKVIEDAHNASGKRDEGEWRGTGLWGLVGSNAVVEVSSYQQVTFSAFVQNDARDKNGHAPITIDVSATVPDDWENVKVEPEETTEISDNYRVKVSGRSPIYNNGTAEVQLHVTADGVTLTHTFPVKYV